MAKIKINKDKCKGCFLCIAVCKKGLLAKSKDLNKRGLNFVIFTGKDKDCVGCNFCAMMCPDVCIEVE
jgi:2-oxoglutarate ferredoxin oxidoreductase subunit delta